MIIVLASLFATSAISQNPTEITGNWQGILKVMNQELTVVFHINKEGDQLSGTMDSPDQGATGIPMDEVSYTDQTLVLKSERLRMTYEAQINEKGQLSGTFTQMGLKIPLDMDKVTETKQVNRPQEPKPPFPYFSEDVAFENKDAGIKLAGTLTYPKEGENFPAVILISGSGAQNRDEELLGHKPFLVIADFLSRNGYAVLRYDDRGVASSEGDYASATSYDFSTDAEAAFDFLKTHPMIDAGKIGFCGHSEGGMIAPMIAARNQDVAFIILMAGPAIPIDSLMGLQTKMILETTQIPAKLQELMVKNNKEMYAILKAGYPDKKSKKIMWKMLDKSRKSLTEAQQETIGYSSKSNLMQSIEQMHSPWFKYFMNFDPEKYLTQVKCQALALNGTLDLQVPAKENLEAIRQINKKTGGNYTIKYLEGIFS